MQMNIPVDLKLSFMGYFLRSMDCNCKITTTLSNLCSVLHIPLKKLEQLLTIFRDEGIIALTRLGVYEEQEICYLFSLKTNSQTEELLLLYQNQDKKHEDKENKK